VIGKLILYARLARALLRISKNPDDVAQFFICSDLLAKLGAFGQMEAILRASPGSARAIRERTLLSPIDLEAFARKPEGSLARAFAEFMTRYNLDPNFYPSLEVRSDPNYVVLRMRQMHDIIHVVTGFDTSEEGELGVQGFLFAQIASPLSMILVGSAALSLPFHKQEKWVRYMNNVTRGWLLGRSAELCFAQDWDLLWDLPLTEVRRRLGFPLQAFGEVGGAAKYEPKPAPNATLPPG
jgi:ubiquinone biosynthesis protein Coq4